MVWLASYFSYFANSTALGLIRFDFVNAEWARSAVPRFGELVLGGVIGTLASLGFPGAWAPTFGNRAPPYSTSLNRKRGRDRSGREALRRNLRHVPWRTCPARTPRGPAPHEHGHARAIQRDRVGRRPRR